MTVFTTLEIQGANASALNSWFSPNKGFTSGFDPRTSDNAILSLLSGGLSHARQNGWLNAGRSLIDKTYVQILFVTQGLSNIPFINSEITAAALDNFIREQIAPRWSLINDIQKDNKSELAAELINSASCSLFGSLESEVAASHLLFYLCPTLPIVPVIHKQPYSSHSQSCLEAMKLHQAHLDTLKVPMAEYGSIDEINRVNFLLNKTDWWSRNVIKVALFNQ